MNVRSEFSQVRFELFQLLEVLLWVLAFEDFQNVTGFGLDNGTSFVGEIVSFPVIIPMTHTQALGHVIRLSAEWHPELDFQIAEARPSSRSNFKDDRLDC